MRILHVSGFFLPHKGGIAEVVYQLSKAAIAKGHKVTVLTSDMHSKTERESIDGIDIIRVPSKMFWGAPIALGLAKVIKQLDFDVMHVQLPPPLFFDLAVLAGKRKEKPIVLSSHGTPKTGLHAIGAMVYDRTLFNLALKKIDALVTSTEKIVDQSVCMRKYKHKNFVIPLGVDLEKFKETDPAPLRKELGLENKKVILTQGINYYKGLEYLIPSMKHVLEKHPDAVLVIIGKGDEKEEYEKLTKNLGLTENVIFAGFVPDERLAEYHSLADAFVLASPNIEESYGLVALEALACGTPTIVTKGAGISEVFTKDALGPVVTPRSPEAIADAVISILEDDKSWDKAKAKRKILEEKYSWNAVADRFFKVYEKVLTS